MKTSLHKYQRVFLHFRCLVRKGIRGQGCDWHWQHLLREFGFGEYCDRKMRLKTYRKEAPKCSI